MVMYISFERADSPTIESNSLSTGTSGVWHERTVSLSTDADVDPVPKWQRTGAM